MPKHLDQKDIDEIKERERKATEGPWTYALYKNQLPQGVKTRIFLRGAERCLEYNHPKSFYMGEHWGEPSNEEDWGFIAHAREDIPNLLFTLESKTKELEEAREALRFYADKKMWDQPKCCCEVKDHAHVPKVICDMGKLAKQALGEKP